MFAALMLNISWLLCSCLYMSARSHSKNHIHQHVGLTVEEHHVPVELWIAFSSISMSLLLWWILTAAQALCSPLAQPLVTWHY